MQFKTHEDLVTFMLLIDSFPLRLDPWEWSDPKYYHQN
ncbi:hypothetical protein ES705_22614 [subsurface metagenome]